MSIIPALGATEIALHGPQEPAHHFAAEIANDVAHADFCRHAILVAVGAKADSSYWYGNCTFPVARQRLRRSEIFRRILRKARLTNRVNLTLEGMNRTLVQRSDAPSFRFVRAFVADVSGGAGAPGSVVAVVSGDSGAPRSVVAVVLF